MEANGQFHTGPLYPQGNSPLYPLDRRLDGPQNLSGRCGEKKNLLPLPGIETQFPSHAAHSQLLHLPSYPGSPVWIKDCLKVLILLL
jgi:hypothetical protein